MVHRDNPLSDPPVPPPPDAPVDRGTSGESIPAGRMLPGGLRVLDRIGSTPEGTLYHAEYLNGLEVALVILRPEAGGTGPLRRERVGRAMQIRHPNVAAVHQVGELEDGSVFVVVEQLAGEPLSTPLSTGRVFALPPALDLAAQAAAGLQAAHLAGFVHGNLSPHTMLLTAEDDGRSRVKLIGFSLDPAFREGPVRAPNAGYASPERLVGQAPDERSDVYSLGAVLHHLLTGRPPDRGHVESSVPDAVRTVLDTALAPAPERRFQTIAEMSAALEQPILVAGGSRRLRTRWAGLIGGALAGLALVTSGILLFPGSRTAPDGVVQTPPLGDAPVGDTIESQGAEPALPPPEETTASPPAGSSNPAPPASPPAPEDAPAPRASPPPSPPRTVRAELAEPPADRQMDTGRGAPPAPAEPEAPPLESRAQVYLRIGLDEASRQLGRPVHAIEGMTPLFLGLARSRFPGYTAAGPAVRAVYMGPNGSLILLDQQRMRPGRGAPTPTTTRWRIGEVMLYLHGEAPPRVLSNLARRVR